MDCLTVIVCDGFTPLSDFGFGAKACAAAVKAKLVANVAATLKAAQVPAAYAAPAEIPVVIAATNTACGI